MFSNYTSKNVKPCFC